MKWAQKIPASQIKSEWGGANPEKLLETMGPKEIRFGDWLAV